MASGDDCVFEFSVSRDFVSQRKQTRPMLELSDQQLVDLVNQLPTRQKRTALVALASEAATRRDEWMQLTGEYAE